MMEQDDDANRLVGEDADPDADSDLDVDMAGVLKEMEVERQKKEAAAQADQTRPTNDDYYEGKHTSPLPRLRAPVRKKMQGQQYIAGKRVHTIGDDVYVVSDGVDTLASNILLALHFLAYRRAEARQRTRVLALVVVVVCRTSLISLRRRFLFLPLHFHFLQYARHVHIKIRVSVGVGILTNQTVGVIILLHHPASFVLACGISWSLPKCALVSRTSCSYRHCIANCSVTVLCHRITVVEIVLVEHVGSYTFTQLLTVIRCVVHRHFLTIIL